MNRYSKDAPAHGGFRTLEHHNSPSKKELQHKNQNTLFVQKAKKGGKCVLRPWCKKMDCNSFWGGAILVFGSVLEPH